MEGVDINPPTTEDETIYLHSEFITAIHVPASTSGFETLLEGNKELAIARGRALRSQAFRNVAVAVGKGLAALFAGPLAFLARLKTTDAISHLDAHLLRDIGIDPRNIAGAVAMTSGPAVVPAPKAETKVLVAANDDPHAEREVA